MNVEQNDYSFIVNEPPKKGLNIFGSSSKMQKILIGCVGLGLILILLLIIFGLFTGESGDGKSMTSLLQKQTEIIRVANLSNGKMREQKVINFITNTNLSTQSSNNDLTTLVKKQGVKVDKKELLLGKDSKNDQKLSSAEQSGNYDLVISEIITSLLNAYQKEVKTIPTQSKSYKSYLIETNSQINILLELGSSKT